ncbi:hypothetical protein TBLA_0B08160 [Henningerozyma blattae CBS 6284]|uniref:Transcription factor CBF/NF-Y/archaeal histone domain-containing protein n=1 Tax=Henningerozyma blattae (strain ATCC 34711 / CBS 6284 / DSM 70876 / NBRC 10599 / NRRL Y-10934 / UCD 77-7) TaxID=1071380 RepID=I2GZT0_HENB6|nr:hypothetical protein TBLA_0B08160 [Tetrapisispora blattae CBS 6284]CCH59632.1 hypothetical protein TBLA_0B08160 [Tetrapisispora blattae CBS 6284]
MTFPPAHHAHPHPHTHTHTPQQHAQTSPSNAPAPPNATLNAANSSSLSSLSSSSPSSTSTSVAEPFAHITTLRDQDRLLPINNVARIMKQTLPPATKVSKDAKLLVQECLSEFISFVTSEAADRCDAARRKTLSGEDVLVALHELGFEHYAALLRMVLARHRTRPRRPRSASTNGTGQLQGQDQPDWQENDTNTEPGS